MSLSAPRSLLATADLAEISNFRRDTADALDAALYDRNLRQTLLMLGGQSDLFASWSISRGEAITYLTNGWTSGEVLNNQAAADASSFWVEAPVGGGPLVVASGATIAPAQISLYPAGPLGLTITGFDAAWPQLEAGFRDLYIFNLGDGAGTATLVHQSVLSLEANRFSFPDAADYVMRPGDALFLRYSDAASRWAPTYTEGF